MYVPFAGTDFMDDKLLTKRVILSAGSGEEENVVAVVDDDPR